MLKTFSLYPTGRANVQDHLEKVSEYFDIACALVNLNLLAEKGLLNAPYIRREGVALDGNRIFSRLNSMPALRLPSQKLGNNINDAPEHLRPLLRLLTTMTGPLKQFLDDLKVRGADNGGPGKTVYARGENHQRSGNVLFISSTGVDIEGGGVLVIARIAASMRKYVYLVGIHLIQGAGVEAYRCSCTNG